MLTTSRQGSKRRRGHYGSASIFSSGSDTTEVTTPRLKFPSMQSLKLYRIAAHPPKKRRIPTDCFTAAKPAMHAPLTEDHRLTPDNDPAPAPFGAFAPNAAQAAIISMAHRSRLKRGAFRPMLSRLVNLLRAGPVDVQYQGAAFRFYHQASATERGALFNPDYNLEELDFLRAHIPTGGVFVDVGANVGTYAMVLARHVGARGKVIAVEPHPVTHPRLAFNRAASGFAQVALVAAAAGPADGELMIETDGANLGASRVVSGARRGIAVPSLRLQRILDAA